MELLRRFFIPDGPPGGDVPVKPPDLPTTTPTNPTVPGGPVVVIPPGQPTPFPNPAPFPPTDGEGDNGE